MSHVAFKHIKGIENSFTDQISHLESMDKYELLETEEGGKEFGHFMFKELSPISAEEEGLNTCVNHMDIQHTTVKLNWDEIRGQEQVGPYFSEVIKG